MKAGTALFLYVVGALALVVALIMTPAYTMFTGEIFIGIFVLGLMLALGNTIAETRKLVSQKVTSSETTATA